MVHKKCVYNGMGIAVHMHYSFYRTKIFNKLVS